MSTYPAWRVAWRASTTAVEVQEDYLTELGAEMRVERLRADGKLCVDPYRVDLDREEIE